MEGHDMDVPRSKKRRRTRTGRCCVTRLTGSYRLPHMSKATHKGAKPGRAVTNSYSAMKRGQLVFSVGRVVGSASILGLCQSTLEPGRSPWRVHKGVHPRMTLTRMPTTIYWTWKVLGLQRGRLSSPDQIHRAVCPMTRAQRHPPSWQPERTIHKMIT